MFVKIFLFFVNINDGFKHIADTDALHCCRWHDRETEHLAEILIIEDIAFSFHFVIHIESHNDTHIHVDKLRSKEEITFQVRSIDDVKDYVWILFGKIFSNITFLWRIFCYGISSRQVDEIYCIAFMIERAGFQIDSDATVVAHFFMETCSVVEERRLSSIRISYQSDSDIICFLLDYIGNNIVGDSAIEIRRMRISII